MKRLIFIMLAFLTLTGIYAQDKFITTWKTDTVVSVGYSDSTSIYIPTDSLYSFNYDIDWENDGVFDTLGVTGSISHDYGVKGTYAVAIRGTFPAIKFDGGQDALKLLSIEQWGSIAWVDMSNAFSGCENMVYNATDAPDLSAVTDMSRMFWGCSAFNGDISNWDVSNATNLGYMFSGTPFNQNIASWDLSNLTNGSGIFYEAHDFNQDISSWDVSNMEDMSFMFADASSFNQDISTWKVDKAKDMLSMFEGAQAFNQDLSDWNVSNVTNMQEMFADAKVFNQNISQWDVSKVNNMSRMFNNARAFNKDISAWKVDSVTNMSYMFQYALVFNQDISQWNVSNVSNMRSMFEWAGNFDQDISAWDVSNVTNMQSMFEDTYSFNQDLSSWNFEHVENMRSMFEDAVVFDQSLGNWNITGITGTSNLSNIFWGCGISSNNYDATLNGWSAQNVTSGINLGVIFIGYCNAGAARDTLINTYGWTINDAGQSCAKTDYFVTTWYTDPDSTNDLTITIPTNSAYTYNYDIDWDNDGTFDTLGVSGDYEHVFDSVGTYTIQIRGTFPAIFFNHQSLYMDKLLSVDQWGSIQWEDMSYAFAGCENFNITATDSPDLSSVTNMAKCFYNCTSLTADLDHWDVSSVENMSQTFMLASAFNGDLSNWDVSSVSNMFYLFNQAASFNGDLSSWDVSNVLDMRRMFRNASSFNGDITTWDVSKVTEMDQMFYNAENFNVDISNWNVSNVIDMRGLFYGATSFNSDISNWNVSKVESMFEMFMNASAFNSDISNWDVSKVTNMKRMFNDATSFTGNLGDWDVGSVTSMLDMFKEASSFNQNLGKWDLRYVTQMDSIFHNSNLSALNYDGTLNGWAKQKLQSGVELINPDISYCQSTAARDTLIIMYGWTIEDNGTEIGDPVPDVIELADIKAECGITNLNAPTATACSGIIIGTHNAILPITRQDTTVVTWTFEDDNGNTSTQAQNIVITDETEPEISCVAYHVINTSEDYYMIQGTELDPENITDNCEVENVINDFTNTETLDGAILPSGSNTITWTVSDMAGNINTCTSEIMVSISTSMEITQSGNIVLFPNPAKDEVFIKGIEELAGEVSINIYDVKGSLVYMGQISGNKVDVSTFEPGVYFMQLSTSEEISTIKFIKN